MRLTYLNKIHSNKSKQSVSTLKLTPVKIIIKPVFKTPVQLRFNSLLQTESRTITLQFSKRIWFRYYADYVINTVVMTILKTWKFATVLFTKRGSDKLFLSPNNRVRSIYCYCDALIISKLIQLSARTIETL